MKRRKNRGRVGHKVGHKGMWRSKVFSFNRLGTLKGNIGYEKLCSTTPEGQGNEAKQTEKAPHQPGGESCSGRVWFGEPTRVGLAFWRRCRADREGQHGSSGPCGRDDGADDSDARRTGLVVAKAGAHSGVRKVSFDCYPSSGGAPTPQRAAGQAFSARPNAYCHGVLHERCAAQFARVGFV